MGHYRDKLAVKNMQRIRSVTGLYNHWDDHEFINDFSIPEQGRPLYNRGVRAFRSYMPVTFTNNKGIYRSFRWGKNLELFFLDQRSFRSAKASSGGTCDNPETGAPDLAPTAPQSTRNVFSALVPSLSEPVSQACKNRINSPNRTYLGHDQLYRFLYDVEHSTARWKVVMNELPIQQFYALPYDRWEGYAFERVKLLNVLQKKDIDHLVFLTTDVHAGLANVVRERTLSGDVAPSNAPRPPPSTRPTRTSSSGRWGRRPSGGDRRGDGLRRQRPAHLQRVLQAPAAERHGHGLCAGRPKQLAEVTVTETAQDRLQGRERQRASRLRQLHALRPYVLTD